MVVPAPAETPLVSAPSEAAHRAARALIRWGTSDKPELFEGFTGYIEVVDAAGDILFADATAKDERAAETIATRAIHEVAKVIDRETAVTELVDACAGLLELAELVGHMQIGGRWQNDGQVLAFEDQKIACGRAVLAARAALARATAPRATELSDAPGTHARPS